LPSETKLDTNFTNGKEKVAQKAGDKQVNKEIKVAWKEDISR